jgi:ADP-ribosylation factor related protein 1
MFSLVYGLWEYLFKVQNLHVLIIGLDYAGKSSLLERIKSQLGPRSAHTIPMDKIPPTIGMNCTAVTTVLFVCLSVCLSVCFALT